MGTSAPSRRNSGIWRSGASAVTSLPPGTVCPVRAFVQPRRRHRDDGRSWPFAFNHGSTPVTLPAGGLDLLTGREVTGSLDLPAGGAAVVREVARARITP